MAFLNFIKKKPADASGNSSQGQNQQMNGSTGSPPPSQGGGSYNGIGNTPGGGEPYNGIGNPSSGEAYNGIGNTANGQAPYNGIGNTPGGGTPYNGIGQAPASQNGSAQPNGASSNNPQQENAAVAVSDGQTSVQVQSGQPQDQSAQSGMVDVEDNGNTQKQNKDANKQGDAQANESVEKKEGQEGDAQQANGAQQNPQNEADINSLLTRLTQRSNKVFMASNKKAKELKSDIDSEHLLGGLLTDTVIYKTLQDQKINPQQVEQELNKIYKKGDKKDAPQPTPRVKNIIQNSMNVARSVGYEFISPDHMLIALLDEGQGAGAQILQKMGMKKETVQKKLQASSESKGGKKGEKTEAKSSLEQFTTDLTAKAESGELSPVIGRHEEIERVIHILARKTKNNPCMVGEPGTGKTAIVEGLAQRIVRKEVPDTLAGRRILTLEINNIIAGASHRGEFEERLKQLVNELKEQKGQIILFIDEIHTIVGAGGEGASDASNFLKPAMARGEIQLVGATTVAEFRKYIEKDPALERRFQKVHVPEPTEEETIKMLQGSRDKFEAFHRVKIPDEAIEACVHLSKRYIGDRYLPDKAFDLMDESSAAVKLPLLALPQQIAAMQERVSKLEQEADEDKKRGEHVKAKIAKAKIKELKKDLQDKQDEYNFKKAQTTTSVSIDTIKDIISQKTGVPVSKMGSSESEKLASLEDIMHKRMIGQERAVNAVAQAVRRGRSGLKAKGRPIGGFVFLGPSGTGKTELAKTLAETMFGQEEAMIRFDMTEYMEKHEIAKLLGPPPGYVGYEEGGKLTNAVRQRPYCVVLFDEVEKAHPDIFNIMLQILDDGRLTDNKGHVVSFKDAVVICTSNIGSKMIQKELLGSGGDVESEAHNAPISTYAVLSDGTEVISVGDKTYVRGGSGLAAGAQPQQAEAAPVQQEGDSGQGDWQQGSLEQYFADQKVSPNSPNKEVSFPKKGYDTHTISPQGVEILTKDKYVFSKQNPQSNEWDVHTLEEYFADSQVPNANPNAQNQALPKKAVRTHAFSPEGIEYITYGDRMWKRQDGTKEWETTSLKDYFKDAQIQKGTLPTSSWDVHVFMSNGEEMISAGDSLWYKDPATQMWMQESMKEYFGDAYPLKKGQLPSTYTLFPEGKEILTMRNTYYARGGDGSSTAGQPKTEEEKQQKGSNPLNSDASWGQNTMEGYFANQTVAPSDPNQSGEVDFPSMGYDTHAVSPQGVEMITKDNILYFRDNPQSQEWKAQTLATYFNGHQVVNGDPTNQDQQLPVTTIYTHAFLSDGEEIFTFRDRFWRRTGDSKEWQTGFLKDYFLDQTIDRGSFPIDAWNIHTVTPQKREIIISGDSMVYRDAGQSNWKREEVKKYFGEEILSSAEDAGDEMDDAKYNKIKDVVMAELLKFFRPELVNRFDAAIVFEPLRLKHVMQIARLNLKSLNKLVMEQGMTIQFTEAAIKEISIEGYDPLFGARPLRRSIQKLVENPLSELIIQGKVKEGDMITVDWDGNDMIFDTKNTYLMDEEEDKETTPGTSEPKNFTPLDFDMFLTEHFPKQKDEIMKQIGEIRAKTQAINGAASSGSSSSSAQQAGSMGAAAGVQSGMQAAGA